eukprot:12751030-Alexandrium_andersonii.AAC.1
MALGSSSPSDDGASDEVTEQEATEFPEADMDQRAPGGQSGAAGAAETPTTPRAAGTSASTAASSSSPKRPAGRESDSPEEARPTER